MASETGKNFFEELHGMTGAASGSPDTAPTWFVRKEASKGNEMEVYSRGSVSFDFVFASLIFILILGFSIVAYSSYADNYLLIENKRTLEASALSISEILVKSKGQPSNWENDVSGLEVLGLAESENTLSTDKVSVFDSLSVNQTKSLLGITNDFFISIESVDGETLFSKGNDLTNTSSVSIERIVYYNRTVSRLGVRLYE